MDNERFKQKKNRFAGNNQTKKPSRYELDRIAARRLQPGMDAKYGGGACYMDRSHSRAGDVQMSRSSSRGGYRSDPEHEIEIQLQCLGSQDDSGGSHRGCSVEDEDEIIIVEDHNPAQSQDMYRHTDSGESRVQSRNGYKSDGSHGSTGQESPMHLKPACHNTDPKHRVYSAAAAAGQTHINNPTHAINRPQSYSASQLNSQYIHHPLLAHQYPQHRLGHQPQHPSKHLEASRSFHTFQRQESTTSFHSTHSAPSQHHPLNSQAMMVNNIDVASQASTHSHSSSSSASMDRMTGPPEYQSLIHQNPPPSYDQALIKLDIAMRRRANNKRVQQQPKRTYNSLHYVGEFYG